MLVLADIPFAVTAILVALFLFVCVLLILAVLIQRPTGGGLSGAFGSGAGSGQTAFGAKTGDALTIATIAIFTVYLLIAIGLNFAARPATASPAPPAAKGTSGGQSASTGSTGQPPATGAAPAPTGAAPATGAAPIVPPPRGEPASTGAPAATGATGSTAAPQPTPPAPTGSPAPTAPPR